jgi:hypothetical protein
VTTGPHTLSFPQLFVQSPANVIASFLLSPSTFGPAGVRLSIGSISQQVYIGQAPLNATPADFYSQIDWRYTLLGDPGPANPRFKDVVGIGKISSHTDVTINGQGNLVNLTSPGHAVLPYIPGTSPLLPNPSAQTIVVSLPIIAAWVTS